MHDACPQISVPPKSAVFVVNDGGVRRELPDINGPFRGSHAVADGWLTKKQLRNAPLTRVFQDVYVPRGFDLTHPLLCQAAALVAPRDAVLTGLSAAAVRGFDFTPAGHPVEFIIPNEAHFQAQRGLNVRRSRVTDAEREPWQGIRIATGPRLLLDVLTNTRLRRSLPRCVGLLDALLRAGFVQESRFAAMLDDRHDHGIVRAREAMVLADPRAESVPESEVRVLLTLAGLVPQVQVDTFDDHGRFLGRLDLAYPEVKVAVEYDGQWHADNDQPSLDAARRARMIAAGWTFVVVKKDDLYGDSRQMVEVVREALRRRRFLNTANAPLAA